MRPPRGSLALLTLALCALMCRGLSDNDTVPASRPHHLSSELPEGSLPQSRRLQTCYYDKLRSAHCAPQGQHIVFMGDSITRYQWLALVASFHGGSELCESDFPSLVSEWEWTSWIDFFRSQVTRFAPNYRCDCHRIYGSNIVENLYFWTLDGSLNMTYIQVLGLHRPVVGNWAPSEPLANESYREVHEHYERRWQLSWIDAVTKVVRLLQPSPTVLVLNTGLWEGLPSMEFALKLRKAAEAAAKRVIWKTTTRARDESPDRWQRTDLLARRVFPETFDAALLTSSLPKEEYWDASHFRAPMYNKLNAALLRQLYGEPDRCPNFMRGKCDETRRRHVPAAAAMQSKPSGLDGWRGVQELPPAKWSVLQALLWIDSVGVRFDARRLTMQQERSWLSCCLLWGTSSKRAFTRTTCSTRRRLARQCYRCSRLFAEVNGSVLLQALNVSASPPSKGGFSSQQIGASPDDLVRLRGLLKEMHTRFQRSARNGRGSRSRDSPALAGN